MMAPNAPIGSIWPWMVAARPQSDRPLIINLCDGDKIEEGTPEVQRAPQGNYARNFSRGEEMKPRGEVLNS